LTFVKITAVPPHYFSSTILFITKKMIMNTVKQCTKAICLILLTAQTAYSQQNLTAKNFIGFNIGIDWTSISGFMGYSYERLVYGRAAMEIGIRGSYTAPYSYGNFQLLNSSFSPPITEIKLGVHGYLFPDKAKINTGFFFTAGAGIESSTWKENRKKYSSLSPTGELGFGWKLTIGKKTELRWTNALGFATRRPFAGGDMATTSAIALGF
jgi:hypothetical protein